MEPLPWKWALFVWGYALAWFLVNDRVKLLAYWILDHTKAGATPEARAQRKPEAKAQTPSDLTPQIAARAYELYQERVQGQSQADQDWLEAEREIRHGESPK